MATSQWLFGIQSVLAALKSDPDGVEELRVARGRNAGKIRAVLDRAQAAGVRVQWVDREQLERDFPAQNHQGVAVRFAGATGQSEEDLYALVEREPKPFLLLLDGVTDPHNLGACLRTADGAGVHAVIVPRDKAVGLTPVVRKVACGAAETLPFFQVTNLRRCIDRLKQQGVWMIGTSGAAQNELYDIEVPESVGIIMGAEGDGMRRLTTEACDYLVKLPMRGQVESLNVSVATGVVLYECVRRFRH